MDVKEADRSHDKDSNKLRCAIENYLFGLSQDLRKQCISILESIYHSRFITDESAVQHEQDHRDELAEAILNSCMEADIIRELVDTTEFYRVESYSIKVREFPCDRHRPSFN